MGLQPHCVDVQAIFFGADYQRRFKKLLSVLHQNGAGVLVHPILGRMPNMICVSASFRHEADYINYVAVDLSFKEATEAEPIFVFESPLVTKIDDLINQLEDFLNAGTDFWQKVMANVGIVQHWKARLLGIWGGLYGTFYAIRRLFDLDKKKYAMSSSVSQHHYAQQGVQALGQISETTHSIIIATENGAFRIQGLKSGEVAIYDQSGSAIVLKQGKLIEIQCDNLAITASQKISLNSPLVEVSEVFTAQGQINGNGGLAVQGGSGASFSGSVTQTGGSFSTEGDVSAGGTSLKSHKHNEQGDGKPTSMPI